MDLCWLVFLAGLALLPPLGEIHKQLILLGFAVFQILEGRLLRKMTSWKGPALAVAVKLALATLLIGHTGELAINSRYYPIFYVPVVTAAMLFGPAATLAWTGATSTAYLSYLWPALQDFRIDAAGIEELALRVLFLFLVAMIINRFVMETRGQRDLYRHTAEDLDASNRELRRVQADARRAERLAALGQLSAGLAHEIRNPLAVIKGSAEMLEQNLQHSDAVSRELAGYISSEVNRANQLVSRFLDFARPGKLHRVPTAVVPLLDRALEEACARWPQSAVAVERSFDPALADLPLDATLMERAFANLASNAFEAMANQNGRLQVAAAAAANGGARIEFRDTGPGVPGELRDQIFNPFFTTKPAGVGLGLAIVAKIVDQHGGTLRLIEDGRAGAAFEIVLPPD